MASSPLRRTWLKKREAASCSAGSRFCSLPLVSISNARVIGRVFSAVKKAIFCSWSFSKTRKSSFLRSGTICFFLSRTVAKTLTRLTSLLMVGACWSLCCAACWAGSRVHACPASAHTTSAAAQGVKTLVFERMYTFIDTQMPAKRAMPVISAQLGCR